MAEAEDDDFTITDSVPMAAGTTRPVLELVLLAIIEGHFGLEYRDENLRRLRDAVRALTDKPIFWSPWIDGDQALIDRLVSKVNCQKNEQFLARIRRADQRSTPNKRQESSSHMAKEVVAEIRKKFVADLDDGDLAVAKRIHEKYTGTFYKKQKGKNAEFVSGVAFPRVWHYTLVEHDYVAETIEAQIVDRILEELAKTGVRCRRQRREEE